MRWYVRTADGKALGPLEGEAVRLALGQGVKVVEVAPEDSQIWVPVESVPAFAVAMSSATPAASPPTGSSATPVKNDASPIAAAGVILVGALFVVWAISGPAKKTPAAQPDRQALAVGTDAFVMAREGRSAVYGFTSRSDLAEAGKAAVAHDEFGFRKILSRAIRVDSGTKALILERASNDYVQIRLRTGPDANESLWVVEADLQP